MDVCCGMCREKDDIRVRLLKINSFPSTSSSLEENMEFLGGRESSQKGGGRSRFDYKGNHYHQQQQDRERDYRQEHQGFSKKRRPLTSSFSASFYPVLVFTFILVAAAAIAENPASAYGDPVYIRKMNGYSQLLSSDTLRWFKQGMAKDPLKLIRPNLEPAVICRVWHTSLRGVGLVAEDQDVCNISTQEGAQGSDKYQTLSSSASRLVWKMWQRPNPPPMGAVAISFRPAKFLATDLNSTVIGYMDPNKNLGSGVFPNEQEPTTSCLVLTEIEPERYELSSVRLKRNKGFMEEDIVLAYGRLKYEVPTDTQTGDGSRDRSTLQAGDHVGLLKPESNEISGMVGGSPNKMGEKGKVESILSYETNTLDSWGQGYLMAKGLHTAIKLNDGSIKTVEWGIPSTQAGKTETMTAVGELAPGTGMNVTLRGTRIDGEMSYWATLKTIFKDGSSSTRLLEGHRRIKDIQDIRLEHSKIYFLFNESIVPDPTTTTTTTTIVPFPMSEEEDRYDEDEDGVPQGENAQPVESRNEFLADQGHTGSGGGGGGLVSSSSQQNNNERSNSPEASVARSGAAGSGVTSLLVFCTSWWMALTVAAILHRTPTSCLL